ncbi:MAG: glycosyltransferase, partial [Candidatus Omnitrophica bacterium]|nr:glycosyltransferase [Candidatus Omnitrophota bacterium]
RSSDLLSRQYGMQMILELLPDLKEKIPQIKFLIIGKGDYEKALRELAEQKGLGGTVEFKGFIEDNNEVEKILCRCAVGMAPYVPFEENYIYYADPGKPKLYLGCGLPIVITRFPAIADEIDKRGAGIAVEYERENIKEAVVKLLKDDSFYKKCRENAVAFSREFDTNYILEKALKQTLCLKRK